MNIRLWAGIFLFTLIVVFNQSAFSKDGSPSAKTEEKAVQAVVSPENAGNTICPVTGDPVDPNKPGVTYEYKGKVYNLCCPMCVSAFGNDPEKYSKKALESVPKK